MVGAEERLHPHGGLQNRSAISIRERPSNSSRNSMRPSSPPGVRTGYFRTSPVKDQLVGAICTDVPEGLKEVIDEIPELTLVDTEQLTRQILRCLRETQAGIARVDDSRRRLSLSDRLRTDQQLSPQDSRELLDKLNKTLFPAKVRTGLLPHLARKRASCRRHLHRRLGRPEECLEEDPGPQMGKNRHPQRKVLREAL